MLGVCYYPEQWPEELWGDDDARRMRALGIDLCADRASSPGAGSSRSRAATIGTGSTAPSRSSARRGLRKSCSGRRRRRRRNGWSTAIPTCCWSTRRGGAGASAPPPLPTLSAPAIAQESRRIVTAIAARYGESPHVAGWQTDNEYGCHDTTLSYSDAARGAFRDWLEATLRSIEKLERGLGQRLLVDGVPRFRRDRGAEPRGRRSGAGASARFPPLRLRAGRRLQAHAGRDHPAPHFARALRHPQFHELLHRVRPLVASAGPRLRLVGHLSARPDPTCSRSHEEERRRLPRRRPSRRRSVRTAISIAASAAAASG